MNASARAVSEAGCSVRGSPISSGCRVGKILQVRGGDLAGVVERFVEAEEAADHRGDAVDEGDAVGDLAAGRGSLDEEAAYRQEQSIHGEGRVAPHPLPRLRRGGLDQ